MLEKYKATIHGDKIEWDGDAPDEISNEDGVGVYVMVIKDRPSGKAPNGKKAAAILQKFAERGGVQSINDPVKWQRSIRKDRKLPGRS